MLGPEGCTYLRFVVQYERGEKTEGTIRDDACILPNGKLVIVEGITDEAREELNESTSGSVTLLVNGANAPIEDGVLTIPEDGIIETIPIETNIPTIDNKRVFVIRVVAPDAQTTTTAARISDEVFGTNGDTFNLKSQYAACSYDQLTFEPVTEPLGGTDLQAAGVGRVDLDEDVRGVSRLEVTQSVLNAADIKYGSLQALINDGIIDNVMICLPPGTTDDTGNWLAYGSLNSWLSVYNNDVCNYPSFQMHTIGYNINLANSNEDGEMMEDVSGMMGFSIKQDQNPVKCFNAPKNRQLGWYTDGELSLAPLEGETYLGRLFGISDYNSLDTTTDDGVLIQITGYDLDYYVSFNRQTGINSGTQEGGDQVLVHSRKPGTDYSFSTLHARMNAGGVFEIPVPKRTAFDMANVTDDGNLNGRRLQDNAIPTTIRVIRIDTGANPGFALVQIGVVPSDAPSLGPSISTGPSLSIAPSDRPSDVPSVVPSLSFSPSLSMAPSDQPSSSPSVAPSISFAPSQSLAPSDRPTVVPSKAPSISFDPTLSVSPSDQPSDLPSVAPSISQLPTSSLSPSISPSDSPSIAPSISFAPSETTAPSQSQNPTSNPSASPSVAPSISAEPSVSAVPTLSFKPSVSLSPSLFPTIDCNVPKRFRNLRSIPRLLQQQISCPPSISITPTESIPPSVSFKPTTTRKPTVSPTDSPTTTQSMPPISGLSARSGQQKNIFQKFISNRERRIMERNNYAFP